MRKIMLVFVIVMALSLAAAINADVTIKRTMSIEIAGMPPSELTSTEQLQGDKSRNVTEVTGGGMRAMMGGQQSAEVNITRLDKGVMWNLNDRSKTYFEIDFKSFKDMMDKPGAAPPAEDEADKYDWTFDVKREDKTTDNGFKCQAVIAVADGVNKEDPEDKVQLRYEFWMSEDLAGISEMDVYLKRYAEVTGVDQYDQGQMIDKMGMDFGPQLKKLAENFKDMKGFPIKTVITARKSGVAGMPGMPEGAEMDPEAMAMMQKMTGGTAAAPAADGLTTVFSTITEVISVNSGAVDGAAFDIPEGYTKQ